MATIELNIPDTLFDEWATYADAAGLSVEAMLQEATTHSVRNDRLGVEQARLQRLLRETREIELLARQGKAAAPSAASTEHTPRIAPTDTRASSQKAPKSSKPATPPVLPDASLEDARIPEGFFEETGNMANLELNTPRDM